MQLREELGKILEPEMLEWMVEEMAQNRNKSITKHKVRFVCGSFVMWLICDVPIAYLFRQSFTPSLPFVVMSLEHMQPYGHPENTQ